MTQRDWTPEFERYLAATDVREELERIPGVTRVSVGGRLRDRRLVEEMCFHVYVDKKRPESELRPEERVPRTIRGFVTDVLIEGERAAPVEMRGANGQADFDSYPVLVGGIRFTESRNKGQATIGCFARRKSDNKPVALTCFHNFFPNEDDQIYSDQQFQTFVDILSIKVGQPKTTKSCCCTCNEIGVLVRVKKRPVDAAIILLNPDVQFLRKIKRIPTPYDGSPALSGVITGTATAVAMNQVWKVGAVTGLTRGQIWEADPGKDIQIEFPGTAPLFLEHGDSGSVLVDALSNRIVGLCKKGSDWSRGIANARATPIQDVLDALDIEIDGDPTLTNSNVVESVDELFELPAQSPFAAIAERARHSSVAPLVREFKEVHLDDLIDLVNESRPGKVAWQRAQGPSYMAALARSAKEPAYRIPEEIGGVTRADAAAQLRAMLETHGSAALRELVERHGDVLEDLLVRHDTLDAMIGAYDEQALAVSEVHLRS